MAKQMQEADFTSASSLDPVASHNEPIKLV